jgi:hypothetical protein
MADPISTPNNTKTEIGAPDLNKTDEWLPDVNITLGADGLFLAGGILWIIWDRLLKNRVVNKLDGVFAPIEEERRLNNLLAQVGIITNSSRVVLTAFHNGAIDNCGYHLTKLSTINSYTAPGKLPMAVPIRDLPVGRIMYELEELIKAEDKEWVYTEYDESLPEPCKDHLRKNNIAVMYNRLVKVGNLPIGILSLQFDNSERRRPPIREEPHSKLLEQLYNEIAYIMRRRIVHPGPIRKLLMRLKPVAYDSHCITR